MPIQRIVANVLAKQREHPVDLTPNAQQPKAGINEHPLDFVAAEDGYVKYGVDRNCEATVQEEKECRGPVLDVCHQKPGSPKHQHVNQKERIDLVPRNDVTSEITLIAD